MKCDNNSSLLSPGKLVGIAVSALVVGERVALAQAVAPNLDLFEPAHQAEARAYLAAVAARPKDICLVSVHGPTLAPGQGYLELSRANQRDYAQRHGYRQFEFEGRISGPRFLNPEKGSPEGQYGGGLNWQKLAAVATVADIPWSGGAPACRWMFWVDTDVVVTNMGAPLEQILQRYGKAGGTLKDVILAREDNFNAGCFVNSGVFFVRNSWGGRRFLQSVADMYERYKNTVMTEQDAVQNYAFNRDPTDIDLTMRPMVEAHLRDNIALTPQRVFNSFYWPTSPATGQWQPCDFLGHVPGGDPEARLRAMQDMIQRGLAC